MNRLLIMALAAVLISSCGKKDGPQADTPEKGMAPSASTPPPAQQDITTPGLVKLDPAIQQYQDAVDKAKAAYDAKAGDKTKAALVESYTSFANYMTYDSPVTPRQGKYRRALVEYRHALALAPGDEKIQGEIAQIESIYREMGRPIPHDEM